MMPDKRGANRIEAKKRNRERILKFMKKHPEKSRTECAEYLGLSYYTICNHLKEMEPKNQDTWKSLGRHTQQIVSRLKVK